MNANNQENLKNLQCHNELFSNTSVNRKQVAFWTSYNINNLPKTIIVVSKWRRMGIFKLLSVTGQLTLGSVIAKHDLIFPSKSGRNQPSCV